MHGAGPRFVLRFACSAGGSPGGGRRTHVTVPTFALDTRFLLWSPRSDRNRNSRGPQDLISSRPRMGAI